MCLLSLCAVDNFQQEHFSEKTRKVQLTAMDANMRIVTLPRVKYEALTESLRATCEKAAAFLALYKDKSATKEDVKSAGRDLERFAAEGAQILQECE